LVFYYWDSEVVERVIDLVFVEMVLSFVGFDSEPEFVVVDLLGEFY